MIRRLRSEPALLVGLVVALVAGSAGGCGGSEEAGSPTELTPPPTEPWAPYCVESLAFVDLLDERRWELFEPTRAEEFLAEAIRRLEEVEAVVPQEVRPSVSNLAAAYRAVDAALVEVDYDVARLDDATLARELEWSAEVEGVDFDEFLVEECGLGVENTRPPGPEILSDEELEELLGDGGGDGLQLRLVEDLAAELGVAEADAACVVEALPDDLVADIAAGRTLDGAATAVFADSLRECGLDP